MPAFKYENCTSKQYVRNIGWIPEAKQRLKRIDSLPKPRRLRYLTFCAEGAIDVIALRNANIIKRSAKKLYDTVVFFDFAPQSVQKTLDIIEGANGFPIDFFKLVNLDFPDELEAGDLDEIFRGKEESDTLFLDSKDRTLYFDFKNEFPFDLMNLDVERYLVNQSEELPGRLLLAWDKLLEWQKRPRNHDGKPYSIQEFTLFFTTKLGPADLPEPHRDTMIGILDQNLLAFPELQQVMQERFAVANAGELFASDYAEFMKLAVPKALVSRALTRDWVLDPAQTFRAFEFDRQPEASPPYTMMHYVLHFTRCVPSLNAQINPLAIPHAVQQIYSKSVEIIFNSQTDDVDLSKIPIELALVEQLEKLGVVV